MKKVNIAYALKANKRIVGRISEIRNQIGRENSMSTENTRSIDVLAKDKEVTLLVNQLINNKAAIAVANVKIAKDLFTLAEKKAEIAYLRALETFDGSRRDPYNTDGVRIQFTAALNKVEVSERVERIQGEINDLQDKIDEFNATELIEIE